MTDKYGPIDFEDQFFQAFQAGADHMVQAGGQPLYNETPWDLWAAYCDWLEAWLTEEDDV